MTKEDKTALELINSLSEKELLESFSFRKTFLGVYVKNYCLEQYEEDFKVLKAFSCDEIFVETISLLANDFHTTMLCENKDELSSRELTYEFIRDEVKNRIKNFL